MRVFDLRLLLLLLLLPAACTRRDAADPRAVRPPGPPAREALDAAAGAQAVSVAVQSIGEVEAWIAGHRGKVVVVDLWALW